jgi:hypothetical protein
MTISIKLKTEDLRMTIERGAQNTGGTPKAAKGGRFLGSLKDALLAAGRDEQHPAAVVVPPVPEANAKAPPAAVIALPPPREPERPAVAPAPAPAIQTPTAEEAARMARTMPAHRAQDRTNDRLPEPVPDRAPDRHVEFASPPTTRVMRREVPEKAARTQLVRGRQKIERQFFEQDPVVGFLIVVGGPGLGCHRPVFEGNNTVGRTAENRVPLDFGDDTISAEAQAYIRYDSADRSFLFVPNLAKTNVVSVNDKRPSGAVPLKSMDVITLGRTQVAFLPFCGAEFDWSEISEAKD